MKRIAVFLCLIIFTSSVFAETKIIAHRGFSAKAPENTPAAFKKAIRSHAEYFELDVHKSADDSLMVIHDPSVDRTSSNEKTGKITEMSYAEIRDVKVGYPEYFKNKFKNQGIPTLKESLALAKGKIKVCIEIKTRDIESAVLKTVNDLNMNDEVIIFSFYYDVLEKIRELDPDIPILYLKSIADDSTIKEAVAIKETALGVSSRTEIDKDYLQHVHNNGLELWRWTVNKESDMEIFLQLDIDGLVTNYPNKAIKLRKKIQNQGWGLRAELR